jgi:cell wall-associated NlpC family hydrolase
MLLLHVILRASLCTALLVAGSLVQAAPDVASKGAATTANANAGDELDKLLLARGLIEKVQQAGNVAASQVSNVTSAAGEIVVSAMGFLGLPYKRGGNSFETGFDCSGFVKALYAQTLGKVLPRSAAEQAAQTTKIESTDLQPGDLVFFNTMRRAFSHVGIYVGDGKFIHSPKPGAEVRIEDMHTKYWDKRYNGARRVEQGAEPTAATTSSAN